MKNAHTTSAEKAVVLVFMVAAPLGAALGYNLKRVPDPVVETRYEVRTVDVGDYEWAKEENAANANPSTGAACQQAMDDLQEVRSNLNQHDIAVSQITKIIQDLYPVVSGNSDNPLGETNRLAGEVEQHKYSDWTRLNADTIRINNLEASINKCAGITEGE